MILGLIFLFFIFLSILFWEVIGGLAFSLTAGLVLADALFVIFLLILLLFI